jgi:hypothetical protein
VVLNIFFTRYQQVWWRHSHISPKAEGDTSPDMIFLYSMHSLGQWYSDFVTQNLGVLWATFRGYASMLHSFIPLACAECDNSLPFSGASSIPLCYTLFPATLLHQVCFCTIKFINLILVIYNRIFISLCISLPNGAVRQSTV